MLGLGSGGHSLDLSTGIWSKRWVSDCFSPTMESKRPAGPYSNSVLALLRMAVYHNFVKRVPFFVLPAHVWCFCSPCEGGGQAGMFLPGTDFLAYKELLRPHQPQHYLLARRRQRGACRLRVGMGNGSGGYIALLLCLFLFVKSTQQSRANPLDFGGFSSGYFHCYCFYSWSFEQAAFPSFVQ